MTSSLLPQYPLHCHLHLSNNRADDSEAQLNQRQEELSDLILEVLRRHPYLCYFQGYHDICQVLLLVLPPELRAPAMARLSALRIRDFMFPTLAPAVAQLRLIPDILRAADPKLWRHVSATEPWFALSGTLTMYAHDITTLGEITRLFDVLLAREPVFSLYMFVAIMRSRRDEVFAKAGPDEPDMIQHTLSKLPNPLDLEAIIAAACDIFDHHPPESLAAWRHISPASVLKTARDPDACADQSLADGRALFDRHARDIAWAEQKDRALKLMRHYRRPAQTVGLAIAVGVAAVILRRYYYPPSHAGSGGGGGGGPGSHGVTAYVSQMMARGLQWWSSSR